ncbi:MAG: nodulation protein NfeD [Cyclobacteriaceae bacterium]|nr:nodulation protein NfeD [Cyclobacteriaceae bacterium]MCH8516989.1 nodulation protein NfeD [Cyclobacteriaceae bacterium]
MKLKSFIFLFFSMFFSSFAIQAQSEEEPVKVFLLEIKSEIDPRSNRYVRLGLEKAKEEKADVILIEMDTYGGALPDADEIRTAILDLNIPSIVFINKDAASAGALISLACDSIFMAPGGSIGAATVVTGDGQAAPDKYQSYMRGIMRSTAEAKGRNPQIAEAMVDENIEIEGITEKGRVLTFSTSEAIKHGFAQKEFRFIDEVLKYSGYENYTLIRHEVSGTEKVISFFINPLVSGILVLIILGGIYFELQTPGVGFPIAAAIIAATLYFIPFYLTGLAENWEILIFFVGVILLAVEIFVFPGFGVAGITGLILMIFSLTVVTVNNDFFDFTFVASEDWVEALVPPLIALLLLMIGFIFGGDRLSQRLVTSRIALQTVQSRDLGYVNKETTQSMVGKIGKAYTVLRPGGKVIIDGEVYDARSIGNFVDAGTDIVVVDDFSSTLRVKELG